MKSKISKVVAGPPLRIDMKKIKNKNERSEELEINN
jgi:hypothetical protein